VSAQPIPLQAPAQDSTVPDPVLESFATLLDRVEELATDAAAGTWQAADGTSVRVRLTAAIGAFLPTIRQVPTPDARLNPAVRAFIRALRAELADGGAPDTRWAPTWDGDRHTNVCPITTEDTDRVHVQALDEAVLVGPNPARSSSATALMLTSDEAIRAGMALVLAGVVARGDAGTAGVL
jgi:hypothetical protein